MSAAIITCHDDPHAELVSLAARMKYNERIQIWETDAYPLDLTLAFQIGSDLDSRLELNHLDSKFAFQESKIKKVWLRRHKINDMPFAGEEKKLLRRDAQAMYFGIYSWLERLCEWVNPFTASFAANSKPLQLFVAKKHGLKVPETILCNDREMLKDFSKKHHKKELIAKSVIPVRWKNGNDQYAMYSTLVDVERTDDPSFRNNSFIWQVPVEKSYELRVTVFGDVCLAAQLHTQEVESMKTDWREGHYESLRISPYKLPADIERACFAVLQELGIVFGAFDFIVTPSGEYYFLEVNESGNFLWVEDLCPEIELLDHFLTFLLGKKKDKKGSRIRLEEVMTEYRKSSAKPI